MRAGQRSICFALQFMFFCLASDEAHGISQSQVPLEIQTEESEMVTDCDEETLGLLQYNATRGGRGAINKSRQNSSHQVQELSGGHWAKREHLASGKSLIHSGSAINASSQTYLAKASAALASFSSSHSGAELLIWALVTLLFVGYCGMQLLQLHSAFEDIKKQAGPVFCRTFSEYLRYRFAYWLAWTPSAKGTVLMYISIFIIMVGTPIYYIAGGVDIGTAVYKVFAWLTKARPIEDTEGALLIGAVISIASLLVFAAVVALVQEAFNRYLESVKSGSSSSVVESGHVLILGCTSDTMPLIQQLCEGHEPQGGIKIVLLAQQPRTEIESMILAAHIELRGSSIIVRQGHPHKLDHLKQVAADTCSVAILLPERKIDKELRDAFVIESLITLCSAGFPDKGWILAVCSLERNRPIMQRLAGPDVEIVALDSLMGKLMVNCSRQGGLGSVISSLFSFEGSEFYVAPLPAKLVGCCFKDVAKYFPQCVPVGKLLADQVTSELCPDFSSEMQPGESIIVLAEDSTCTDMAAVPRPEHVCQALGASKSVIDPLKVEKVLIFGFNETVGEMLLEVDVGVLPGSQVQIFSRKAVRERESFVEKVQMRNQQKFQNISITHIEGVLGSRFQLEGLPIKVCEASRIFVVSEDTAPSVEHADSCTVTTVLQIRDIMSTEGQAKDIPIIPEIHSSLTEKRCHEVHAIDLVNSSGIRSQYLAMTVQERVLTPLYLDLLSSGGNVDVVIRKLGFYTQDSIPAEVSFLDICAVVEATGDLVIGWSNAWIETEHESAKAAQFNKRMKEDLLRTTTWSANMDWEINPVEKKSTRIWSPEQDRIVVITRDMANKYNDMQRQNAEAPVQA